MGRDTIAGLIAGILQKYTKKEDDSEGVAKHTNASFVEIALADEEEGVAAGSEEGSRPVTALRRTAQSPAVEMRRTGRTPTGKSFEAYASTEEEVHESHTAYTLGVEYTSPPAKDQDSLTLPDSLNEFEGEQYQSPQVYPDSLGHGGMVAGLDCPPDSLQFPVSPTPALASKSPLDSLIAIKNDARAKMTAAEFFDSITSIEKTKPEDDGGPSKRRIIPYCDNSLSSGTSAFTSQDVSFDSKDSSPSDNDRGRQVPPPPSGPQLYPPALTLAIQPINSPHHPPPPVHPLSRRYQASTPTHPTTSPLRIEDYMATVDEPQPNTELDRTPQGNANEVRRSSESPEGLANQTKDSPAQAGRSRDASMSMAKAATEKLKWKFLGW